MSLDNTSHPGGPGPDELIPSRYALQVGEIDVMVVSDGVLSLPGAMLGYNVDPGRPGKDMFLPLDVLDSAPNVVVVRSGGRTILIDGGIGMEFPDLRRIASRWWPLTCRSRPSAMWRWTARPFDGYQAPGNTDRLSG